ncbi:uncharacterized protein LOC143026870 [Oratosquilla oratoria]|uniref:uncharacterized protein LOC143026870 n=1 Tax=Oratosquilla oratoria TaxID=337810 RepID=UPI003F76D668
MPPYRELCSKECNEPCPWSHSLAAVFEPPSTQPSTQKDMKKYIGKLFADVREELEDIFNEEGPDIMEDEIKAALSKLTKGKGLGEYGMATEMFGALGDFGIEIMTEISNKVYGTGELTVQMCQSVFIALPKIHGTLQCSKHRKISVMNHLTKII